jgi:hypothetical protein
MPEQPVLLAAFSTAPISETPNLMTIVALKPVPTRGAPKSATRSKILLESLKVDRNRIKGRNPLLRDAHHDLRLLDLRFVAEMRPARKTHGFVFGVLRARAARVVLLRCRAAGVHPRKRTGVYLYELSDEDAVEGERARREGPRFSGMGGERQDRSSGAEALSRAAFPETGRCVLGLTVERVRLGQAFGSFEPEWEEREEFPVEEDLAEESCDVHAEVERGGGLVRVEGGVEPCESAVAG